MDNELRDGINRILFHIQSNEERADKIAELIAPELDAARKWDRVKSLGERTNGDECDKDCPYFTAETVDGCKIFAGCPFCQVVDAITEKEPT